MTVAIDGPFLAHDGRRLWARGVTYGTFAPADHGLFPPAEQVRRDFAAMADAGINTVRTYTVPPEEIFDLAAEHGLWLLAGVWWADPRYLTRATAGEWDAMAGQARTAVSDAARRCGTHPALLGFLVGNEIPGPVVRFHGRRRTERLLGQLYAAGKDAAPDTLFGYANYPTTAYLDTGDFDFEAWNLFLEGEDAYRRYLARLQVSAAGRPVLITETGLDSGAHGEDHQACVLDWQVRIATEQGLAGTCVFAWTDDWWVGGHPVDGWSFGLTHADRSAKPALDAVSARYRAGLVGCRDSWPRASVVVCAYNEERTIGRCVESLLRLDYPSYEVIVVDDGSTDDTASIACRYPVWVLADGHRGLSSARNLGIGVAQGDVVAFIDADAWADPEWLAYLVLGIEEGAAGAGGPNMVPPADPLGAQCIGRAPGGPCHVLLDDVRAEHVPGCNMAFRRDRLLDIGGFDPVYRSAGDDVDVCWKLLDRGEDIRFQPAALVWHHPRQRIRDFWRQQIGYGRAEALVARRHPDRFTGRGHATWRGRVYGPAAGLLGRRSVLYAGTFGDAPFQRLYARKGRGLPWAAVVLLPALGGLAFVEAWLLALPLAVVAALAVAGLRAGMRVARRAGLSPAVGAGSLITLLSGLQPLARAVGHMRGRRGMRAAVAPRVVVTTFRLTRRGPGRYVAPGVLDADRPALLRVLRDGMRAQRLTADVAHPSAEADVVCESTLCWRAEVTTYVQWNTLYARVRIRPCLPRPAVASFLVLAAIGGWAMGLAVPGLLALGGIVAADGARLYLGIGQLLTGPFEVPHRHRLDDRAPRDRAGAP